MAAYFLDSSALVKRYVLESGTPWIRNLCDPAARHTLYIARITGAEVIAALSRRIRMRSLTLSAAQSAITEFRTNFANGYIILEMTPTLIASAMDLAQEKGLRGYDAVQLAAALDVHTERNGYRLPPLTLVSADNDLNQAAISEGLMIENPNAHS